MDKLFPFFILFAIVLVQAAQASTDVSEDLQQSEANKGHFAADYILPEPNLAHEPPPDHFAKDPSAHEKFGNADYDYCCNSAPCCSRKMKIPSNAMGVANGTRASVIPKP